MKVRWPTDNPDFYKINSRENLIKVDNLFNLEKDFYEYALSFKNSARTLAEYISESPNIRKLDVYFFSVAYLYRHSLELILKAIAFKHILEIGERKKFLTETGHDLSLILKQIDPYIDKGTLQNRKAYNWIESLFEDASKFDKASDSFRYPFAITVPKDIDRLSRGKEFITRSFFDKQTHIDLIAFINKMEIAFDILENHFEEKSYNDSTFEKYNAIFLEEGGSYYSQSVVGYSYNQTSFFNYVNGYIESANYLYKYTLNSENSYFIPMCYLYRNGIELVIKEILFEECLYSNQEALKIINQKKHSIKGLWKCIEHEIIHHAQVSKDDKTIANVKKYIDGLHNLDPQSDKFRYPINKNFGFHFKRKNEFDIENVSNYFEELFDFLSNSSSMMAANNDSLSER